MRRFFVNSADVGDKEILITDKNDYKHIKTVLRLKPGDEVSISDGDRFEYRCSVKELIDDKGALFTIEDKQAIAGKSMFETVLFQGVPKASKMEEIIQKTVELGVTRVVPVFMKRTVVKGIEKYREKTDRFNQIAFEASKQCRRPVPAEVLPAIDFDEALEELDRCNLVIFSYEGEQGFTIKEFLMKAGREGVIREGMRIGIVVGPEGGIADSELSAMLDRGYMPVCIARTILRTETAAPAILAMIHYQFEL